MLAHSRQRAGTRIALPLAGDDARPTAASSVMPASSRWMQVDARDHRRPHLAAIDEFFGAPSNEIGRIRDVRSLDNTWFIPNATDQISDADRTEGKS